MKIVTMKEWGLRLPIGMLDAEGNRQHELAFRPHTGKIIKAMGHWRKQMAKDPDVATEGWGWEARQILHLLALRLTRYGSFEHQLIQTEDGALEPSPEMLMHLRQAPEGDVFAAYVLSRYAMEEGYEFQFKCPKCKHEGSAVFPMGDIELTVLENDEERKAWLHLKYPIPSGRPDFGEIRSLLLVPPAFDCAVSEDYVSSIQFGVDTLAVLPRCVVGVNLREDGGYDTYTLLPREVDEMSGLDIARTDKLIRGWAGLDFNFQQDCPGKIDGRPCTAQIQNMIDWRLGNFYQDSIPESP